MIDNIVLWVLLFVVSSILGYLYWRYVEKYAAFPSCLLTIHVLHSFLTRKVPRDVSFPTFIFQELVSMCKTFKNEGLFIAWFGQPYLFVYSEEAIKVFTQEQAAVDKPAMYSFLEIGFGKGLITSNEETWRRHRKIINPAFHIGLLKDTIPIFHRYASVLVRRLEETHNKPTEDILLLLRYCTYGSFTESILGLGVIDEDTQMKLKRLTDLVTKLSEFIMHKIYNPLYNWKYVTYFSPYARKNYEYLEELLAFSEKILNDLKIKIFSRKTSGNLTQSDSEYLSKNHKSFAEVLLDLHMEDPSFTMTDVRDQVNTFIIAGFDTVSYTLMWCLFFIGLHPEVQEQAFDEVSSFNINDIKYENLHEFSYLDSVIKETLRIHPTVPLYARRLTKDVKCGKYNVPTGTNVVLFAYMWHRDPQVNPDPEKFDPDRFHKGDLHKRSWTHIPFAEGIRSCIGKNYAMAIMKIILVHVLQNFKITTLDQRKDISISWQVVLSSAKPIHMQFTPRQQHNHVGK